MQWRRNCLPLPNFVICLVFFTLHFRAVAPFKFSLEDTTKFGVDDSEDAENEDELDNEEELEDDEFLMESDLPLETLRNWGQYGDLAVAFPIVLQNLTNYSGLINGQKADSENITYKFGNPKDDEELLYDKVSGFFTVLHESMEGQDGPRYCPRHSMKHIKECLVIASCLLQSQVPTYVEMPMYASMIELLDRFVEEGWPLVERGLLKEEHYHLATLDEEVPTKYKCDAFSHPHSFVVHLQVSEDSNSAMAMSMLLAQKSHATHEILDSHRHNMSVEETIRRVMEVWSPLCLKAQIFSCDERNWWDLHYASHGQTMALMETGSASALRAEIRTRLALERRVKAFMREHHMVFGGFLQQSSREGTAGAAADYFDYNKRSEVSVVTWKSYGQAGKEAMLRFVVPYSRAVAAVNETRAMVWFDQVEFGKFQKDEQNRTNRDLEPTEMEEVVDRTDRMSSSRALLAVRETSEESEESEELEDASGRRRKKKDSSSPRRRGESRRRRRRKKKGGFGKKIKKGAKKAGKGAKKAAKKTGKVVKKGVEIIEKYVSLIWGCIGDVFEFITVGYQIDVVPGAVSFAAGLSVGDMAGFLKLLTKGKKPSTWMSLDVGFAVGATSNTGWVGVALGIGISCGVSKCVAYGSVGTMGTVNLPTINAVCVFGAPYTASGWQCSQVFGGAISAFCCNFNVATGKNDCR